MSTGSDRSLWEDISIAALVRASTDMSLQAYMEHMRQPAADARRTWGGFLEAALMCARWQCRAVFFVIEGKELRSRSFVGGDVGGGHYNRGRIPLLWSGGKYDVILMTDEELVAQLP